MSPATLPSRGSFGGELGMNYIPFKTLEQLKRSSPSRQHGLTEEQEDRWRRATVNLIISAGGRLKMDVFAVITALEFMHRFFAQYSMVTNDRFLVAIACLFLGGKVAESPKSCTDIIVSCVEIMTGNSGEANRLMHDREWLTAAREQVCRAERALLYQLGFRFAWTNTTQVMATILLDKTGLWPDRIAPLFGSDDERRTQFKQACFHLANQSAKMPLVLQYPCAAITAGCIWLAMRMLLVDSTPLRTAWQGQPWYAEFGVTVADLECIAAQISEYVVRDAQAVEENITAAEAVKAVQFRAPSLAEMKQQQVLQQEHMAMLEEQRQAAPLSPPASQPLQPQQHEDGEIDVPAQLRSKRQKVTKQQGMKQQQGVRQQGFPAQRPPSPQLQEEEEGEVKEEAEEGEFGAAEPAAAVAKVAAAETKTEEEVPGAAEAEAGEEGEVAIGAGGGGQRPPLIGKQ